MAAESRNQPLTKEDEEEIKTVRLLLKPVIADTFIAGQMHGKQDLEDVISKKLEEDRSSLEQVNNHIEKMNGKLLSSIDHAFIDQRYLKFCSELWLQEVTRCLKTVSEQKTSSAIETIFRQLDSIQDLNQIPDPFKKQEYYKLLLNHRAMISKEHERLLIRQFKTQCLEQIVATSDSIKNEFVFIEKFLDFLGNLTNLKIIIAELQLHDFCCGTISFDIFIGNVMRLKVNTYGETLSALQRETESLQGTKGSFVTDEFKEIIGDYIKPPEVQERKIDDRLVIEVIGRSIVVSEILQQLEMKLSKKSSIEEVRFVGGNIIHIDAGLRKGVWHGKNVVVFTPKVKVHSRVTWDVSGEDNMTTYPIYAGTGADGNGKRGQDGFPGESGGNVLVVSEGIENPGYLTIVSNGGKGSNGQDGGNGTDGINGKCYTLGELKKHLSLNIVAYGPTHTISSAKKLVLAVLERPNVTQNSTNNCFIEGRTKENYEVTVSYRSRDLFSVPQGLVLVKGSQGLAGGRGGEHGLGGMGGFNGKITVNNARTGVVIISNPGVNGKNGKGGLHGSHGKNGWDIGYKDHAEWKRIHYSGENQSSKLKLIYGNVLSGFGIWCEHRNTYISIESAGSVPTVTKNYNQRTETRQSSERQHHAQATGKKTISQSCISTTYSQYLSSIKKIAFQDIASDLENTRQSALQAMADNKQTEQVMQLAVKRHATFSNINKVKHSQDTGIAMSTGHSRKTTDQDVEDLVRNLKREPKTILNWFQLRSVELNRTHLDELFLIFEDLKTSYAKNQVLQNNVDYEKLQEVEQLLIEKKRIITLQELANKLPPHQPVESNVELSPESAIRYLIEDKDSKIIISHPKLGPLDQYLHVNNEEQRNSIYKFCEEEFLCCDEYHENLGRALSTFILKVGTLQQLSPDVKKYYDEYNEFLETQKRSVKIFNEAFQSELSRPRNSALLDLWLKSTANDSFVNEEEIQKDTFLCTLYNRYKNQLRKEYEWDTCFKDQPILEEYKVYIKNKERFKELLAFVFDVNIRVYNEDEDNKLFLQDNHNPSSERTINLLCRDEKFIRLRINEEYLKLEREFSYRDILYKQILTEVEILGQKQEFGNDLDEEIDLNNIAQYFSSVTERKQIKERLEKITSQFTGQHGILYNLSKRFSIEGRHVSFQALCCLVNSILAFIVDDKPELGIFCWIVAAYPQHNWTDELLLLQLEIYFKKTLPEKSKWQMYLSKIKNKDILLMFMAKLNQHKSRTSITFECVETTLYLLSNIPNEVVSLEKLGLPEWSYALKEPYWRCKLSQLTTWQANDDNLLTTSYYLLALDNRSGTHLVEALMNNLQLKANELSPEILTNMFSNFYQDTWKLVEEDLETLPGCRITEWMENLKQKFAADDSDRDVAKLVDLIKSNTNNSKEIRSRLSTHTDSVSNSSKATSAIIGKPVATFEVKDIKHWVKVVKSDAIERKGKVKITNEEILAVVDRAISLTRKYNLRDTQKLSILTLYTNERNTLAQVSTGEGKSLIVVAMSIMKALCGEKVDVITSSSVLAKRDAEDNKDIYTLFDINVSHNASEDIEERKQAYSNNQVVYGDLSSFQRDYLLDRFYKRNILGDRSFQTVMVDEVDSMLLDKGNNMLYLSHDLAGIDKVESVYLYIWQWINRPAQSHEEIEYALNKGAIKEAVLKELYNMINKDDIRQLGCELSDQQVNVIWERLIQAGIINHQGKMKESVSDVKLRKVLQDNVTKLKSVLPPELSYYEERLSYLLKECIATKKHLYVPNYLKSFVEQHLDAWIDNAITALFMQERDDYIVDIDRTGTSPDLNPNITIIDRDTGTDQANSQWDDGLHQFLQLKHGCKLSLQSLKAVFISNVSYLKLYSKLYGLTGTLGSGIDRDSLKQVHDVDFVDIPTAKPKKFHEKHPIICAGQEEWIKTIHHEAKKLTEEKKRSVLIICDTVDDVDTLNKYFASKEAKNVFTYTRDYEDLHIVQGDKELGPGRIIIATNLAGRGTDIKLTEELKKAGGLHVCITYLPNNCRIEEQAFGRVARKGEKGSGQLIIKDLKGLDIGNKTILDLKKERDAKELLRIMEANEFYETQIKSEESYFIRFKEQYEQMHLKLIEGPKDEMKLNKILFPICLDKWAFWLDENSANIKSAAQTTSKTVDKSFEVFLSKLKNYKSNNIDDCLSWVKNSPVQMVKIGKYLSKNEKHFYAMKLYDEVIRTEPYFSEAAHYYKSYEIGKQINWEGAVNKESLNNLKASLREAKRRLEDRKKFSMNAAAIIGNIKKHNSQSIVQIDGYEEQQKSLCNLYDMFIKSIDDILGHSVTPQSFESYDINETLAKGLYEYLLKVGVCKKPKVKKNFSEDALSKISLDYGLSGGELQTFLSKYRGTEINIKEFLKTLSELQLPSKEEFWEQLIQEQVLNQEVKYIAVNKEKLTANDPSLLSIITEKVTKGELKKESLESSELNQMFLNPEQIKVQTETSIVLREDVFRKLISNEKFNFLEQAGVFSFNKEAFLNVKNPKSITFPNYDLITLQDFAKVNIAESEAKGILAVLVERKILEPKNPESSAYRLTIQSDEIEQLQLPVPMYESAVKILFRQCFAYRIALQGVEAQLKEANGCISIRLITKPHHGLLCDLLEQSIISPVTVATEAVDIEEKLKEMYSPTMTEENVKEFLRNSQIIPTHQIDSLFTHLVQKNWITKNDSNLYSCSNTDECKSSFDSFKEIEDRLRRMIENYFQLSKDGSIKNISDTLQKCKALLKTLDVPNFNLKSVTEFFDEGQFEKVEEINVFTLNGLDHVMQLEEKKYTLMMLLNTFAVLVMGIAQIAIGAVIELYSLGVMTHVGSGFISEGISDIFFAASALTTGYFSWKEYGKQKLESVITTAATGFVGAMLEHSFRVLRFGSKLGIFNISLSKKVAQTSVTNLPKTVILKQMGKAAAKRAAVKVGETMALCLADVAFDATIGKCLASLCDSIALGILSDIEEQVEGHKLSKSLEEIYKSFGEETARTMVDELQKNFFTKQEFDDKMLGISFTMAKSLTNGIEQSTKEMRKANVTLNLTVKAFSLAVDWFDHGTHIAKVSKLTREFLDELDEEMNVLRQRNAKNVPPGQKQAAVENCERFKNEIIGQWKKLLRNRVGQVLAQHVFEPILKDCAPKVVKHIGKMGRKTYKSQEMSQYQEHFAAAQKQYDLKDGKEQHKDKVSAKEDNIREQYVTDIRKCLDKTRNPKYLSSVVQEDIPVGFNWAGLFTGVAKKVVDHVSINNTEFTVILNGKNGFRRSFPTGSNGVDGLIVELQMKDEQFTLCGRSESGNNSFYDAFSEHVPELKDMTRDEFRANIVEALERDVDLKHHIEQDWINVPDTHFNRTRDVNLRINKSLSDNETVEQIVRAVHIAVRKVNEQLTKYNVQASKATQERLRVELANYKCTEVEEVLFTQTSGAVEEGFYPVEMECEVKGYIDGKIKLITLKIHLDNPSSEDVSCGIQGPHCPSVGYEIVGVNDGKYCGRVLLNDNDNIPGRCNSNVRLKYMRHEDKIKIMESEKYMKYITSDIGHVYRLALNTRLLRRCSSWRGCGSLNARHAPFEWLLDLGLPGSPGRDAKFDKSKERKHSM